MLKLHHIILAVMLLQTTGGLVSMASAQNYGKMSGYLRQLVTAHKTKQNVIQNEDENATGQAKSSAADDAKSSAANDALPYANGQADTTSGHDDGILALVKGEEGALSRYCIRHQGDIHICHIPLDSIETLSDDARIKRIEVNKAHRTILNDVAAEMTRTTKVHQGIAPLPKAFDGTGVLVGIQDISFDFNHPTFRSKKDGRMRIVRAWDELHDCKNMKYEEGSKFPVGKLFTTEAALVEKDHSADADLQYHGTHTAGTAAGSGYDTPYSGMAPEADIYTVNYILENNKSMLTKEQQEMLEKYGETLDVLGFQNIFDYADSIGKPCVINFSIGGYNEYQEDDVLYNDYLRKMVGPGKIIVASIGNSGTNKCYMPKTAETKTVGGLISPSSTDTESAILHITTKGPLTLTLRDLYNTSSRSGKSFTLGFDPKTEYEDSTVLNNLIWNGIYKYTSQQSLGNGTTVEIFSSKDVYRTDQVVYDVVLTPADKSFTRHSFLATLEGEGVEAETWTNECQLVKYSSGGTVLYGSQEGGTVVAPGSYDCIIGVGSTAWREQWNSYNGQTVKDSRGKNGERATFSSIGPSFTNVVKPDVMAPGTNVISSFCSTYYPKTSNYFQRYIVAKSKYEGREYQWSSCCGTSMSTPVVTGIIALWLQADPTLTPDRVREIMAKTSEKYDATLSYPNDYYGYGEIHAYRGLLEILQLTGIRELSSDQLSDAQATVRPTPGGDIIVSLTGTNDKGGKAFSEGLSTSTPITLYTPGGQCVGKTTLPPYSTTITIPTQHLHGIVAVQVGKMGSTLVRLP